MSIKHKFTNPLARLHDSKRAKSPRTDPVDSQPDSGSVSSSEGSTSKTPNSKKTDSYLSEESKIMSNQRREIEQKSERQFGRVIEKKHSDEEQNNPEGDLQNDIPPHPWLQSQRVDGADPDVSPAPPLNTEARREYDNALRLQNQLRNEKRMEDMPQPGTAPRPPMG